MRATSARRQTPSSLVLRFHDPFQRPLTVAQALVVTVCALSACFLLASLICFPLLFSVGGYAGCAAALAVNSVVCFALPGFIARRSVVGSRVAGSGGGIPVYVVFCVLLIAAVCQPFLEFTVFIDGLVASALDVTADFTAESNDLLAKVCLFDSAGHWAVALIVVAFLPAFSEELFFRGALLPLVRRASGSWHVAVAVSAVLFSAVHLDPSGFLTRAVMGAVLGALFVVTRSLWASVLFHFANNAMVLVGLSMSDDPRAGLSAQVVDPDFPVAALSVILTIAEVYVIDQYMRKFRSWSGLMSGK